MTLVATQQITETRYLPKQCFGSRRADLHCRDNFYLRQLIRHVKTCHSVSASGRNPENLLYRTRKPQKNDNSGVLENYLVGPDGLEPPTKGL